MYPPGNLWVKQNTNFVLLRLILVLKLYLDDRLRDLFSKLSVNGIATPDA